MKVKKDHYVYAHINNESKVIFYIGQGKGKREFDKTGRNDEWLKLVNKLKGKYNIQIVADGLTQDEAFDLEHELIKKYGKIKNNNGTLVNITDGGLNEGVYIDLTKEFGDTIMSEVEKIFNSLSSEEKEKYIAKIQRNEDFIASMPKLKGENARKFKQELIKKIKLLYYDEFSVFEDLTDDELYENSEDLFYQFDIDVDEYSIDDDEIHGLYSDIIFFIEEMEDLLEEYDSENTDLINFINKTIITFKYLIDSVNLG